MRAHRRPSDHAYPGPAAGGLGFRAVEVAAKASRFESPQLHHPVPPNRRGFRVPEKFKKFNGLRGPSAVWALDLSNLTPFIGWKRTPVSSAGPRFEPLCATIEASVILGVLLLFEPRGRSPITTVHTPCTQ